MNRLIMIFIVVALVAGAGATYFFMLNRSGHGKPLKKPEEKKIISEVPLEERTVNLADSNTAHYLRVVMVLEVAGPTPYGGGGIVKKEGEGAKAGGEDKYKSRLMDRLILTVSRLHYRDLLLPEGKERLKADLKENFTEVLKEGKYTVQDVLFTDFVME